MANRSVIIDLGMRVGGLVASARTATGALKGISSRGLDWVGRNQQSISQLSTTVGALGLAAVGAAGFAVKMAIDWNSAWAGVTKTVDGTSAQLATLEDDLRQLTQTLPASHQEIAAVAEAAGQLGVGVEDVAEFTQTMIELGETTNLTADDAATSLARISNIMGTATSDVDRMGSTIVDLGNNSATTEAEIVALATRLAAAGKQAGLAESDIFAIASTLTSVGVEAEAGGTAMSKVFTSIGDAVRDGNDDLDTFARVSGTTAEGFRRAFGEDAAGAIGMFIEGMGRMSAEGESTSQVFEDLGLTDQRLMRAILSAGSATGLWADQLELANGAWEDNTALSEEAAKRFETPAAQMQIAWNNIKDAAIEFGAVALPMVSDVAGAVSGVAQEFGNLPDPVKTAGLAIVGGGGLVALGLAGLGKLIVGVSNTRDAFSQLGGSSRRARRGIRGVGRAAGIAGGALTAFAIIGDDLNSLFGGQSQSDIRRWSEEIEAAAGGDKQAKLAALRDEAEKLEEALAGQANTDLGFVNIWWEEVLPGNTEISDKANQLDHLREKIAELEHEVTVEELAEEAAAGTKGEYGAAADEAGAAQQGMAGDVADATGEIESQVDALVELVDQLQAAGLLSLSTRGAQRNLEAAIDDATAAAKENGETTDITTEKGRANQAALDDIASSTHDLISSMAEQGASEKQLQGVMESSREQFLETADQMGINETKAKDLADQLGLIPGDYTANIEAEDNASGDIDNVRDKLEGLDGLRSTVYISEILQQRILPPSGIALPGNARGTNNWRGGPTWVGEDGPEIVNVPRGSQIIPADESRAMASRLVPFTPSPTASTGATSTGGMSVENLNIQAWSDRFSLRQVEEELAFHGAA